MSVPNRRPAFAHRLSPAVVLLLSLVSAPPLAAAVFDFETGYTVGAAVAGQPAGSAQAWVRFTANTAADASLVVATAADSGRHRLRAVNVGASGGFRLPLGPDDYVAGGGHAFSPESSYLRYRFALTFESVNATANANGIGLVRLGSTTAQSLSLELLADGRLRFQTWDVAGGVLRNLLVRSGEAADAPEFRATAGTPIVVEGVVDHASRTYTLVVNGVPQRAFAATAADPWRIGFRGPAAADDDLLVNTQNVGAAYFQSWTLDDIELTAEPLPASAAHLAPVTIDVVAAYGADPSGQTDSTAALQRAISENIGRSAGVRTLYLRNGTYLVSDTLQWYNAAGENDAYLTLQGESRDGVILRLSDQNPRFQNADPATPPERRAVIHVRSDDNPAWYANPANPYGRALGEGHLAFHNNLVNFTVDVGHGNPGAVGIDYHASNQGVLKDVVIRSADGQGLVGLALDRKNTGPGFVTGVRIHGFATGILARSQYVMTLEHIRLENQSVAGLRNETHTLAIRGLRSDNRVPALVQTDASGLVVLLDSELKGGEPGRHAIELDAGHLRARNVLASGYASALRLAGVGVDGSYLADYASGAPGGLWGAAQGSLRLPVEETPRAGGLAPGDWALVTDFGAVPGDGLDDSAALQAALSSGRPGVLFAPGTYTLAAPLTFPATVRHVDFNWANLQVVAGAAFPARGPVPAALQIADDASTPLTLEKFQLRGSGFDLFAAGLSHTSGRTLTIQHALFPSFRNGPGAGRLFLADVSSHENGESFAFDYPQSVWVRQFNPEPYYHAKAVNRGGDLWVLGMKTERASTALRTLGGGRTELLGGVFYQNHEPPHYLPLFESVDSAHALTFNTLTDFQGEPFEIVVAEERDGVRTELSRTNAAPRQGVNGVGYALFRGVPPAPSNPLRLPRVHLEATEVAAREGGSPLALRLVRTGDTGPALEVALGYTGTVAFGADLDAPPATVSIPAGVRQVEIPVSFRADGASESVETLGVTVAPGAGYLAGSPALLTLSVLDGDRPATSLPSENQILHFEAGGDLAFAPAGDRVLTWYDLSPAGNHATLTAVERTPRWLADDGEVRPAAALAFDDTLLFLPKSDSLQAAGPYPGRSYYLAFRTGSDVTRRQMIYEQGGNGRGITVYVVEGRLYVCAYNRLQTTALWNEVFRSAPVQPGSRYVLALHLDGTAATLEASLNRLELGPVPIPGTNGGVLDTHLDQTVFGGVTESTRFHDLDVPRRLGGYYFEGLVYALIGYNGVHSPALRAEVSETLALRYLGPPPPPNAPPVLGEVEPGTRPLYVGGSLPVSLTFTVNATDDGRPAGGALTYQWSATRAPAATFATPTAGSTQVTFSSRGIYRFTCLVSDGERTVERPFIVVVQ